MNRAMAIPGTGWALGEERANQATHAFGTGLAVVGSIFLIQRAAIHCEPRIVIGCVVYCATLIALYAASTLSHSFESPRLRDACRMADQICIFLLTAGSFTPFAVAHLQTWSGDLLLTLVWVSAVAGCIARVRSGPNAVAIGWFVVLGWLPLFALPQIVSVGGALGTGLVLGGGLAYTAGTYFLAFDYRAPYYHSIWHMMTITASTCHFLFHLRYVACPVS